MISPLPEPISSFHSTLPRNPPAHLQNSLSKPLCHSAGMFGSTGSQRLRLSTGRPAQAISAALLASELSFRALWCYYNDSCQYSNCWAGRVPQQNWLQKTKHTLYKSKECLRNSLHHGESHQDGANGMVLTVVWQSTDAVIAVSKDLDPQLVVPLEITE